MATGMYPGIGTPLYLASSNAQEPAWTVSSGGQSSGNPVIPTTSKSMGIACNAGISTGVTVTYGTAPSGTAFNIEYDNSPTFANAIVLAAVAAVGSQKIYRWSSDSITEIDGFIRVGNAGGQSITTAFAQQRTATYG